MPTENGQDDALAVEVCVHYWEIESSADSDVEGWSAGQCVKCGEVKMFQNALDADRFGDHLRRLEAREEYEGLLGG